MLYFGRPVPYDDMVIGSKEYVVACASKRVHATLREEPGTGCVFVRLFRVELTSDEFDIGKYEFNLRMYKVDVREDVAQWKEYEILSTVDTALLDRKLEPCDKKELFPSYLGKRNEELIKKARQDSFERACRKRVLNCGPHWP